MARDLISIDEARSRVVAACEQQLDPEDVPLDELLGRVTAEDVTADVDLPPFDCSAMDGFAVVAGPAAELEVVGESRAGHPAGRALAPGEAIRISTGAELPRGAGGVVPVERVDERDGRVAVPAVEPGANVRRAGEDVRAGAVLLHAGTAIGPGHVALAAAAGRSSVRCAQRPRVAVLATGDELVEPGRPLGPGQIRDSNPYALAAQARAAGACVVRREHVGDRLEATVEALGGMLARADVVCVSGGVSVGPHDHVKPALERLGVEERFWGVALKPGKPTWFGVAPGGALVFGLPGNPVSAMVTFQLFTRPALRALVGTEPFPKRARAVLDEAVRCNPGREQAVRCALRADDDGWHARPTGPQGSHVMTSMGAADALAFVPRGDGDLPAGTRVEIELLEAP